MFLIILNCRKEMSDMQNFLIKYRGVILVVLVLFIGCEMMSINARMVEKNECLNNIIVYE